MSDSDWHDPFAEDEAAREREARRAERAARRREREQQARESLGERVREELEGPREPPPEPPAAPAPAPPAEPAAPVAEPEPEQAAPPPPPPPPPPPTRRSPVVERARHRRRLVLLGIGALIILGTGAAVLVSRSSDDEPAEATGKARKTFELVIPEGLDRARTAKVVKQAGVKGSYEKATRSSKQINLKKYGAENATSLEGFLFPATYELFKGAKVNALVSKQLEAFESNLDGVDLDYAKANGLSVYDVVIVASLIEGEIAVPEERKLAASVIYNRLREGTPIGIDATIRFEDQNYNKPLVESRLNEATPYNTRINPGLPPGPINSPGLASLEAAANPAETDYFFYVIKPGTCNEHAFLETDAEFQAASDEYQAALQAEGGSPTDC